jgi:hypothetical protein
MAYILREEHGLMVFENRLFNRVLKSQREELMGSWMKLYVKELNNFYSSPVIVSIIKSRNIRILWHIARMRKMRNAYRVLVEKPERRKSLARPRHRWEDNIKTNLEEIGERLWTACIWLRIRMSGRLL